MLFNVVDFVEMLWETRMFPEPEILQLDASWLRSENIKARIDHDGSILKSAQITPNLGCEYLWYSHPRIVPLIFNRVTHKARAPGFWRVRIGVIHKKPKEGGISAVGGTGSIYTFYGCWAGKGRQWMVPFENLISIGCLSNMFISSIQFIPIWF